MLLSVPSALLQSMLLARLVLSVWPCCGKLLALKHIRWCTGTILPAFATAAYHMVALKAPSLVARAKPSSWPKRDTRDCFRERIQIILWTMCGRHITPQHSTANHTMHMLVAAHVFNSTACWATGLQFMLG
jgi:hypothetical protein